MPEQLLESLVRCASQRRDNRFSALIVEQQEDSLVVSRAFWQPQLIADESKVIWVPQLLHLPMSIARDRCRECSEVQLSNDLAKAFAGSVELLNTFPVVVPQSSKVQIPRDHIGN